MVIQGSDRLAAIDLNYFQKHPPLRVWKRRLSIACGVIAAGWIGWAAIRGSNSIYSSGPISKGHSLIEEQCSRCHTQTFRRLWHASEVEKSMAMNSACLACHSGSVANASETAIHHVLKKTNGSLRPEWDISSDTGVLRQNELPCSYCHVEHRGSIRLNEIADDMCVRCHENLTAHDPKTNYKNAIRVFFLPNDPDNVEHPQFSIVDPKNQDQARIKFNHKRHLRPQDYGEPDGLLGPNRTPEQLVCADCHRAGESGSDWRFGEPSLHEFSRVAATDTEPQLQGAYMGPIRYSLHCKNCHAQMLVDTDRDGEELRVPHDTPRAIRGWLWGELTMLGTEPTHQAPPARSPDPEAAVDPDPIEYSRTELRRDTLTTIGGIEKELYEKKKRECMLCHFSEGSDKAPFELPRIEKPEIPNRWFMNGAFDHERHRTLTCESCHDKVTWSTATADVLLPEIRTCQSCHRPSRGFAGGGGAPYTCVTCHTYHRPSTNDPPPDLLSIGDLLAENEELADPE